MTPETWLAEFMAQERLPDSYAQVVRDVAVPLQQTLFGHVLLDPEVLRMLLLSLAMILMMLLRPAGMIPARARYCHDKHLSQHVSNTLKQEGAK